MAQGIKTSDEQRGRVIALLRDGKHGRNQIARTAGVSTATVTRISREIGIEPAALSQDKAKQLAAARAALTVFGQQRRLDIYNMAVTVAEQRLAAVLVGEETIAARDLQYLVTSVAIAHDKVRMELGEDKQAPPEQTNIIHYVPHPDGRRLDPPPWVTATTQLWMPDNGRLQLPPGVPKPPPGAVWTGDWPTAWRQGRVVLPADTTNDDQGEQA